MRERGRRRIGFSLRERRGLLPDLAAQLFLHPIPQMCHYNFKQPRLESETAQFTQLVWASTKVVGCAVSTCPDGVGMAGSGQNVTQVKYLGECPRPLEG